MRLFNCVGSRLRIGRSGPSPRRLSRCRWPISNSPAPGTTSDNRESAGSRPSFARGRPPVALQAWTRSWSPPQSRRWSSTPATTGQPEEGQGRRRFACLAQGLLEVLDV